jgi:hypothetical protein
MPESMDATPRRAEDAMDGPPPRVSNPLSAEDLARLTVICRAVAKKKRHLFARLPAISIDDIAQAAMAGSSLTSIGGALRAHATYLPPHSYSSWIGRAAGSAVLDLYKTASRERARVEKLITGTVAGVEHDYPPPPVPSDPKTRGVVEMLPNFPRKLGSYYAGRNGHPPDAYFAALLYREEHGLGWRTLHRRLSEDPALLAMLGFKRCPAWRNLWQSNARLKAWGKRQHPPAANE